MDKGSTEENADIIPDTDETHPLPSDMADGADSTSGNAPHAPADITPASDPDDTGQGDGPVPA